MFNTLRNYIVKIKYNDKHAGSGIIIKNNNASNNFYIFTAKHIFFEKDIKISDMKINDIRNKKIYIDNPCFNIEDDIKLEPFEINNEYDFLIIKVSNCKIEKELSTNIFMDEMNTNTNLSIMGFPHIRDKEETEYDSYLCTYKHICKNNKHFEINSDRILTVRHKEGNANHEISGLSGSGVYLTTDNQEISIVGILIKSATGQGIVCFDLRTIIDEINDKLDIPIPRKDEDLIKAKENLNKLNQIFIEYINDKNIGIKELLEICKLYLKPLESKSINSSSLKTIINHISNFDSFPCIIKKLFNYDNNEIERWLSDKSLACNEIESQEAYMSLIFKSKHEKNKYNVTILGKNLSTIPNENSSLDINLSNEDSKKEFISKIIDKIGSSNPKVDLILPIELMNEDISLWEYKFNQSLSRLSRLNIRYVSRYDNYKMMKQLIDSQWEQISTKVIEKQSLYPIDSKSCLKKVGNNMYESGLASKLLLEKEHFEFIFKTNMSYIVLWLTKDCNFDINQLYKDIEKLQEQYYIKIKNNPINLMWDDPSTYYYPNEN